MMTTSFIWGTPSWPSTQPSSTCWGAVLPRCKWVFLQTSAALLHQYPLMSPTMKANGGSLLLLLKNESFALTSPRSRVLYMQYFYTYIWECFSRHRYVRSNNFCLFERLFLFLKPLRWNWGETFFMLYLSSTKAVQRTYKRPKEWKDWRLQFWKIYIKNVKGFRIQNKTVSTLFLWDKLDLDWKAWKHLKDFSSI